MVDAPQGEQVHRDHECVQDDNEHGHGYRDAQDGAGGRDHCVSFLAQGGDVQARPDRCQGGEEDEVDVGDRHGPGGVLVEDLAEGHLEVDPPQS